MRKVETNRTKSTTNFYSTSATSEKKYQSCIKGYRLREKESEFHKEALETTYDRSIESRLFPMDPEIFVLTSSTPKAKKSISKSNFYNPPLSIFFCQKAITPNKRRESSVSRIEPIRISKHASFTSSPYTSKH